MLTAIFLALRDALFALAFGWLGLSVEPSERAGPPHAPPAAEVEACGGVLTAPCGCERAARNEVCAAS